MIAYPVKVGGVLSRVLEAGAGDDVVIFLHGIGARADRWRYNLDPLGDAGFRAMALDFPGHGFAAKGTEFVYSVPGLARFVLNFMDGKGFERPILVGTSLGGHVAAWLACNVPGRVSGLVLVGSLGLQPLPYETCERMASGLLRTDRGDIRHKLERLLARRHLIDEAWIEEEHAINTSPGAREDFARLGQYIQSDDFIEADECGSSLAPLTRRIPTLLIWGEADQSVPVGIGRTAHGSLPGSQLEVMKDCGHLPYLEDPLGFNQLALQFCEQVRTRTPDEEHASTGEGRP